MARFIGKNDDNPTFNGYLNRTNDDDPTFNGYLNRTNDDDPTDFFWVQAKPTRWSYDILMVVALETR